MWTNNKKAISEVNQILNQLNEDSLKKIPQKLLEEIQKNATIQVDYIKPEVALEDINLEKETKEMLAVISYQYFCNEKERKIWQKELEENERNYQEQLREKYNPDKLFDEKDSIEWLKEENALVEYKEPFFKKIWNLIKKFWNRSKKEKL